MARARRSPLNLLPYCLTALIPRHDTPYHRSLRCRTAVDNPIGRTDFGCRLFCRVLVLRMDQRERLALADFGADRYKRGQAGGVVDLVFGVRAAAAEGDHCKPDLACSDRSHI